MSTALNMHAKVFPRDENVFLDADEIERRIRDNLPNAVVDRWRGDEYVDARLQELIEQRTPEIILASHRRLFGRTLHIEVSYPDWPREHVFAYVSPVTPDCDFDLKLPGPFNLALLQRAAKDVSAALGFRFFLWSERDCGIEIRTVTAPGVNDPVDLVRVEMPSEHYPTLQQTELTNWKTTVCQAVLRWLSGCQQQDKVDRMIEGFDSKEALSGAVADELEAIGPVERTWEYHTEEARQVGITALDHGNWMTILLLR
jgi:hypothetical protein